MRVRHGHVHRGGPTNRFWKNTLQLDTSITPRFRPSADANTLTIPDQSRFWTLIFNHSQRSPPLSGLTRSTCSLCAPSSAWRHIVTWMPLSVTASILSVCGLIRNLIGPHYHGSISNTESILYVDECIVIASKLTDINSLYQTVDAIYGQQCFRTQNCKVRNSLVMLLMLSQQC